MKIKKGLKLREMGGVNIVVAVGDMAAKFKGVVRLNESGTFLWKLLENDISEAELLSALLEKYDVTEELAKNDVASFLDMIRNAGFIDE